ncbi:MAG TPA: peptidoglycan-associated lipoprotein Pal [Stellaceae bacterium]|nr:peptidoglycan-associated lipoprotein Pal [Stellaceae bacterium]
MRLIREGVVGVALLALAGCGGSGASTGGSQGVSDNGPGPGRIDRVATDRAKVTLDSAGISDTVYFDYDKTTLRPDALPALQRIAEWMKQNPSVQIRIAGHADERGTREYNLALGDRRATAVRGYLVSLGIPAQRLETMSYGKERPAVVGSNEESWAKNRRAVAEIE